MIKTGFNGWCRSTRAVGVRAFSSATRVMKEADKTAKHIEFLSKFYTPELLESVQITESLVKPSTMLELKEKQLRSRVAPKNKSFDYSTSDPQWDEPILYPNQASERSPYPPIPQIQAADRTDLVLRFKPDASVAKKRSPLKGKREIAEGLAKLTGLDQRYISNLYVRPIVMKRVSCQTSKGKIPNFYALTVVGDKNGMIGLGEGKSRDGMRTALVKAHWNAVKNLTPIPLYENRTVLGEIEYKFHAVKLFIKSAPSGFGLRVNSNIFEVCQAAGIKDLRGKIYKSRNSMNVVKGFVEALTKQRTIEDLAAGRGKKLVDLRKVYYSA